MVKVAVAQMLSGEELEKNLAQIETLVQSAADAGAALVLLPENCAMLDSRALVDLAKPSQQSLNLESYLAELAAKYEIWLIAGSVPVYAGVQADGLEKVSASCLVFDASGVQRGRYDKIHLFDVDVADDHAAYRESDFIHAGDELVVVETPFAKIGLSICYDLRFPEQYQRLRQMGAEVICVPSAFTYVTGQAHWEVLLRARAIETQCYLLAANQGGQHNATRASWGQSMLVDPWGEVLSQQQEPGPGLVLAELDLSQVENRRAQMPVLKHRQKVGF